MQPFTLDEIEVLDYLVETCEKKGILNDYDLEVPKSIGNVPKDANEDNWISRKTKEYYYPFFVRLNEYNKQSDILHLEISGTYVDAESKIPNTKKFIESGGFKRVYEEQQESIMHEELLREKAVNDAIISRFTKERLAKIENRSKWNFWLAIGGFLVSLAAVIIAIYKS